MPELTREEKLKLLEKLPPRLQELMTSEDTGATLLYLGQKYHLSDHQVRLLSKILGDVILNVISVANLPLEISTKVAVDTQTANGLAKDLNDLILSPKPVTTAPVPPPAPPALTPKPTETPVIVDLRKAPTLIEADPHRTPALTPTPPPLTPKADTYREPVEQRPQYIVHPSGLPPTDLPRDVLDLRKDKGEF